MPVQWWTEMRSVAIAALIVLLPLGFAGVPGSGDPADTARDPAQEIRQGWPGTLKEVSEAKSRERQVEAEYTECDRVRRPTMEDLEANEAAVADAVGGQSSAAFKYRVEPGETLSGLAARFDVSVRTLAAVNGLGNPDLLRAGRVITVPPADGLYHRVRAGDTLWGIARRYGTSVAKIQETNDLQESELIRPQQLLFVPAAQAPRAQVASANTQGGAGHPDFVWPLSERGRISSPYGPRWGGFHYGLDIAVPAGTPIRAAAGGRVVVAQWKGSYGLTVRIDHGNGYETVYAHASQLKVNTGQQVTTNQPIARVGTTGRSTGPHLHFEVRVAGEPRDPQIYLQW